MFLTVHDRWHVSWSHWHWSIWASHRELKQSMQYIKKKHRWASHRDYLFIY